MLRRDGHLAGDMVIVRARREQKRQDGGEGKEEGFHKREGDLATVARGSRASASRNFVLVPRAGHARIHGVILETLPDLTVAQKLQLISELNDDLTAQLEQVPVSAEIVAELDRRMKEYQRDPSKVTTWEAIQRRLLGRTLHGE